MWGQGIVEPQSVFAFRNLWGMQLGPRAPVNPIWPCEILCTTQNLRIPYMFLSRKFPKFALDNCLVAAKKTTVWEASIHLPSSKIFMPCTWRHTPFNTDQYGTTYTVLGWLELWKRCLGLLLFFIYRRKFNIPYHNDFSPVQDYSRPMALQPYRNQQFSHLLQVDSQLNK